jgi:hypothetical protein
MDTENKTETAGASESRIPAMHTYRSDMEEAVHDQGASLASIMLAEKKHKEESREEVDKKEIKSSIIYIVLSIVLIVAAIIAVYIFKNVADKASTATVIKDQLSTYISYDKVTHINADGLIGKETIGRVIQKAKSQAGNRGEIETLSLEKGTPPEVLKMSEFFSALGSSVPGGIILGLTENMMLGVYTAPNLDRHVFFIFGVQNYDRALSGTLAWERTILDDMFTVFNIQIAGEYAPIMQTPFEDVVINNKNARIVRDIRGVPALYMLFINKDLLIITDNEDAIQEITNRYLVRNAKPL